MKMEQYELQSYFKSLCNSFYIAYRQAKRLEKEEQEILATSQKKGLQKAIQKELKQKSEEWHARDRYWGERRYETSKQIKATIERIAKCNYSIIVTSEEEIYALMSFYNSNPAGKYPIINQEEQYMKIFPTGKKVCEDFLMAYRFDIISIDDENLKMPEVYDLYF